MWEISEKYTFFCRTDYGCGTSLGSCVYLTFPSVLPPNLVQQLKYIALLQNERSTWTFWLLEINEKPQNPLTVKYITFYITIKFSRFTRGVYLWVSWEDVDNYSLDLNCIKPQSCKVNFTGTYIVLYVLILTMKWISNSNVMVIWMMTLKYECGISKLLLRISRYYHGTCPKQYMVFPLYFLLMKTDVNSLMLTWKISLSLLLSSAVLERDSLQYI